MAAQTLFNAVTAAGTSGVITVTGDFEAVCFGNLAGGQIDLQRSIDGIDPFVCVGEEGIFIGPAHSAIRNSGTNSYRAVYKGVNPNMGVPSASLKINQ